MSTFGKGRVTSSILPCSRVILSAMPLTFTISRAFSMMVDMSTPITCLAPALMANLDWEMARVSLGCVENFDFWVIVEDRGTLTC